MYLLGDVREQMAQGCVDYVEKFINKMKHIKEPFYVVYYAEIDRLNPNRINQTVKAYHQKPPAVLGILVWYVDNAKGVVKLVPELSAPQDIPLNPLFLSDRKEDQFAGIMSRGEQLQVLVS